MNDKELSSKENSRKRVKKPKYNMMKGFRFVIVSAALLCAMSVCAQKKKAWEPPKRPKLVKWEPPVEKNPEVIDVWRPYGVSDNWMMDFHAGTVISLAENAPGHQLVEISKPAFELGFGKQFARIWSTHFVLGYAQQIGCASKNDMSANKLLGDGRYQFNMASFHIDEALSLTKLFSSYDENRKVDVQLFGGVGMNYSWGYSKKTLTWKRTGYDINRGDHFNLALRGGLQMLVKIMEPTDIIIRGYGTWVGDDYNGVKHSDSFAFDKYLGFSVGVRVHLMDRYGGYRYYKVRRSEANALRGNHPEVSDFLIAEKQKELDDREKSETVAFGKQMKTRISFYVDRTFVNDMQMENIRIVAGFLRNHPEVNLIIKGYSGASKGEENPVMHLAEKRVEAVKKALVKYYDVDEKRLTTVFDEEADAPYRLTSDWIDAVVFEMTERGADTAQ